MEDAREHLWLPVARAARHLAVTEHAVRLRIRAGTIDTRREVLGNRTRLLVKVDAKPREGTDPEVFILRERLLKLEALLEEVRGERDRLWAELERRRWPGLWPALRRLIYGIENP